jgi:hypothetical protein
MLTLRCTKRLMRHLAVRPPSDSPQARDADDGSQTLLGAWYANLIDTAAGPMILCVNEHTRYPIPLALDMQVEDPVHALCTQLVWRIHEAMRSRAVEQTTIRRVTDEYRGGLIVAPTASRSVLGTINDMGLQLNCRIAYKIEGGEPIDLEAIEYHMSQTPILPMKGANPGKMLVERCQTAAVSQ